MTAPHSGRLTTPLGPMLAIAGDAGLALCEFTDRPLLPTQLARIEERFAGTVTPGPHAALAQAQLELDEYFAGQRRTFTIPLALEGTAFQVAVWRELRRIPFGRTISYQELAHRLRRPGAARAVGQANGDNPIAIIVPCHRVINADGSLSGYGGGRPRKRWLLDHEQHGAQLTLGLRTSTDAVVRAARTPAP